MPNEGNGIEAYKATLNFIRRMAGMAAFVFLAWLVIPRLGGFFHWVGGLDWRVLCLIVVAPIAAVVLIVGLAIYAVFFRGAGFVERIVNGGTVLEAVRRKRRSVETDPPPAT